MKTHPPAGSLVSDTITKRENERESEREREKLDRVRDSREFCECTC